MLTLPAAILGFALVGAPQPPTTPAAPAAPPEASGASIELVGDDYPEYRRVIGPLRLEATPSPDAVARAEPQFRRLSLVDVETVRWLPRGWVVYQTISTGVELPVNLNIVVREKDRAGLCFNPEIPYCVGFDRLNVLLRAAGTPVANEADASALGVFVVGLGMSTVHRPDNFIFFRLTGSFGVQYTEFLEDFEFMWDETKAKFRSEEEGREYERTRALYKDRIGPYSLKPTDGGWQLHGFAYKLMQGGGDLSEWTVVVHPEGTVDVQTQVLERSIGDASWSFAP